VPLSVPPAVPLPVVPLLIIGLALEFGDFGEVLLFIAEVLRPPFMPVAVPVAPVEEGGVCGAFTPLPVPVPVAPPVPFIAVDELLFWLVPAPGELLAVEPAPQGF
jgi:hypothetical protein